jgi:hypothetical protein
MVSVDKFCHRQFPLSHPHLSSSYSGAKFTDHTTASFEALVNSHIADKLGGDEANLSPGYAPFCKHIFLPNVSPAAPGAPPGAPPTPLTTARVNTIPITAANAHLLSSAYEARTALELPVLTRFFPPGSIPPESLPTATFLDIILYSREQIMKEDAAMGVGAAEGAEGLEGDSATPWGVVSIKPQMVDYELPMNPITAMRNALGEEYGGSGRVIDRKEYMDAVDFWEGHAIVK